MAKFELLLPKMGESIMEATILNWVKNVGDTIEAEETIAEIATDKVDSEVPSPVGGTITKIFFKENDTVPIGEVIAWIETGAAVTTEDTPSAAAESTETASSEDHVPVRERAAEPTPSFENSNRFYSPLVKNIAKKEQISIQELDMIPGTGMQERVTKKDILNYLKDRATAPTSQTQTPAPAQQPKPAAAAVVHNGNHDIIEMDRMRKLIADHMVMSKHTSPHVTSFVEVDVTNLVEWRNKVKDQFKAKFNQSITFTPIFMEATAKAILDFPMINISVQGDKILKKHAINIGMATALPSGNLIVPVIKNADQLNLIGLTKAVNDLADRARTNKLKPEEIQDGTFTITNVGTFGNVMGTPIINQPQVAIMAVGAIRKKPAVVETPYGDLIAVRQLMFLSLSYDHRVVDGFLGGSFLRRVADYLEAFDPNRTF
jgi:2-oxoglutarate dehydrogenase E2 component (dihydrolipoamide succinyltransferase)